ncbi:MAG: O-antigen ligase [Thomasclavelia ramosa]|nr:O-antigen ligase [Thomasclavelia ramosa]
MKYFILIFLSFYILVLWFYTWRRDKTIFNPITFFLIFQFLGYVPSVWINTSEHYAFFSDENVLTMAIMEILYLSAVFIGYKFFPKFHFKSHKKKISYKSEDNIKIPLLPIIIVFSIGLFAKMYAITKIGGIAFALQNMAQAYMAQASGYGYLSLLSRAMLVGLLAMFFKLMYDKKRGDMFIFIVMSLLYMGSYLIYSSRGPALELILVIMCCVNFMKKKIEFSTLFKPKYLLVFLIGGLLASVALAGRSGGVTVGNENILLKIFDVLTNEFSRAGRDIYCYTHFVDEKWYGKGFLNLIYAVIPSSIFPNKPPLDDGLYLLNIMTGHPVGPNAGRLDLFYSSGSIPFTTQGLAYVNFGVLGVMFSGLLMGVIYKKAYGFLKRNIDPFNCCIYLYIIYMFGFSTLMIENVLIIIISIIIMRHLIIVRKPKKMLKKMVNGV